jgi:penicillin-binding protein 1C
VASASNKKTNDILAQQLIKQSLILPGRLLFLIGKPLYVVFSYAFVALLFATNITGYFFRVILINFFKFLHSLGHLLLIKLPTLLYHLTRSEIAKTKEFDPAKIRKKLLKPKTVDQLSFELYKQRNKLVKLYLQKSKKAKRFLNKLQKLSRKKIPPAYKDTKKIGKTINESLQFLSKYFSKQYKKQQKQISKQLAYYSKSTRRASLSYLKKTKKLPKKIPPFVTSAKLLLLRIKLRVTAVIFLITRIRIPRLKLLIVTFSIFLILVTTSGYLLWFFIIKDLPSPHQLTERDVEVSTKIYDRNGVLLYKIFKDKNRTPVKLENIPIQVRLATIAIEDAEFCELTGGSTITQQLVKNALLSSEKTIIRKLREIALAVQVELAFSKDEILEMYLNEVAYGGTAYGVQEASRMYFRKDVEKLTLAEAALLAGLPKSPTQFSPFGPNPDLAKSRQKEVLRLMQVNGYISQEQRKKSEAEEIRYAQNKIDIKAPHFVMYVRRMLEEKYGRSLVEKGGLNVITTLDYNIQTLAEKVIKDEIEKLTDLKVGNGASVVLNPQTGEILAMVGSKDYFNTQADGNVNVTTALRQPGSSIKVVNYSYALSHGYTAASIIEDSPVTFNVEGQPPYSPVNYEGGYRGKLTLRSAFAESRNVPAVKVLASYGVNNMFDQGRKMGISTWVNPYNYGLSLTLGGGDVKLIELARTYATIANYGKRPNLVSVTKVINHKGKVIEEYECIENGSVLIADDSKMGPEVYAKDESALNTAEAKSICDQEQVIDPRIAYIIADILRDNDARAPAFGLNSYLVIPDHSEVAVKTGTSNNLRDNLTVGFNQDYLVAVWVGNNDNSEMARVASGVTGASPIFNKIMSALLVSKSNDEWSIPEGLVQLPICIYTGTLACTGCPTKMEWFLEENKPDKACSPEWFKKDKEEKLKPTGQLLDEAASTER